MDCTYGLGKWWTKFRPDDLVCHDLVVDGVDFRALPEADNTYDVVAYDPPYVSPGGRVTSTVDDFNSRYGLHYTPTNPHALFDLLVAPGLRECARVLKPKGVVLAKSMNYVSSGKHQPCTLWLCNFAESIGLELVDEFVHVSGTGPQPLHVRQMHSRKNHSFLYVLRKAKA